MNLPHGLVASSKNSLRLPLARPKALVCRPAAARSAHPDTVPPISRDTKRGGAQRAVRAGLDAQLDAEERAEALAMRELQVNEASRPNTLVSPEALILEPYDRTFRPFAQERKTWAADGPF